MQLPAASRFPVSFTVFLIIALCALMILFLKRQHIPLVSITATGCTSSLLGPGKRSTVVKSH